MVNYFMAFGFGVIFCDYIYTVFISSKASQTAIGNVGRRNELFYTNECTIVERMEQIVQKINVSDK